ncbi:F0F1 ATP synthase subunit epsilon [Flavobacterium sp. CS20]|jgi:F-type H+-transporting ATPase subunit epsilon|uniref:F0F1 ATP synthase subunit epsilon n=1 Tax=Flavobacterium sp. CS20 TaxID=2775246 RepID=UPI001B3A2A79|nr:F0F1 ATP synthase subunit epsilon [Flavobacterium sp. CS20]QTY26039.1 F0F1 ATP synthase subunit epsilon [Flavobacterium sp. CS20]
MHLEIVTPEQILISQDVDSVTLPGKTGEFQILNQHAPIISTLDKGLIKLDKTVDINDKVKSFFEETNDKLTFEIKGGVVECKDNKVIVLVD